MDIGDLQASVAQILDEERINPTVDYEVSPQAETTDFARRLSNLQGLSGHRKSAFRFIKENAGYYRFKSINYDLLSAVFSQIGTSQKDELFSILTFRMVDSTAFQSSLRNSHPNWAEITSELPLIAEFALRKGYKDRFFAVLAEALASPPMLPLLCEIEDILCFDWHLLRGEELGRLSNSISTFLMGVNAKRNSTPKGASAMLAWLKLTDRIIPRCESIIELCRKAKYLHLKGTLLEGLNLEVNQDKTAVESRLKKMGFTDTLIESLNHAEQLYLSNSPFDLKSSMGHLRSFLENLHAEAAMRVAKKNQDQAPTGWGSVLIYLRDKKLLTKHQEKFVAGLYTLLSDEAVHPLIAEKEAARLSRNMVVEYGLLLLTQLEKAGV